MNLEKTSKDVSADYGDFLRDVKAQIRQRQYQALRAANKELLALYWWLGEAISRKHKGTRLGQSRGGNAST